MSVEDQTTSELSRHILLELSAEGKITHQSSGEASSQVIIDEEKPCLYGTEQSHAAVLWLWHML